MFKTFKSHLLHLRGLLHVGQSWSANFWQVYVPPSQPWYDQTEDSLADPWHDHHYNRQLLGCTWNKHPVFDLLTLIISPILVINDVWSMYRQTRKRTRGKNSCQSYVSDTIFVEYQELLSQLWQSRSDFSGVWLLLLSLFLSQFWAEWWLEDRVKIS